MRNAEIRAKTPRPRPLTDLTFIDGLINFSCPYLKKVENTHQTLIRRKIDQNYVKIWLSRTFFWAPRTERFELGKVLSPHLWQPTGGFSVCSLKKSHKSVKTNLDGSTWNCDKLCNWWINAFFMFEVLFLAKKTLNRHSILFSYLNRLSASAFPTHLLTPSAISSLKITV